MNADDTSHAKSDRTTRLLEQGLLLKEKVLNVIRGWPYDKNGTFPGFVVEDTRPFEEFDVEIERWFNEADMLTRESLGYSKDILRKHLKGVLTPFDWFSLNRHTSDRVSLISAVAEDFDAVIRKLQAQPFLPKNVVSPEFAAFTVQPNSAFILMWMSREKPELEDVSNTFKQVFGEFGIHAKRADDIEHQEVITDVILRHIRESEFLIADLSGERPNVYYEVGYAHAIGKRPILYRKQGTPLHFDLSVHNVPEYNNNTELRLLLRKRLEAMTGKRTPSSS